MLYQAIDYKFQSAVVFSWNTLIVQGSDHIAMLFLSTWLWVWFSSQAFTFTLWEPNPAQIEVNKLESLLEVLVLGCFHYRRFLSFCTGSHCWFQGWAGSHLLCEPFRFTHIWQNKINIIIKTKLIRRDKEGHFILMKGTLQWRGQLWTYKHQTWAHPIL
jgi:hypothetical protein